MIKGTVAKVFKNNFGGKELYSFVLQEQDGVYYSCGEQNPGVDRGHVVEFEATQKGSRLYVNMPLTVKGTLNPNKSSQGKGGFKSGASANTKDDYWAAKEERDIEAQFSMRWQGAYDRALKLAEMLFSFGALKHPDQIKKGGDKAPYIKGVVHQLAVEIYHDTLKAKSLTEEAATNNNDGIEVSDDNEGDAWND